MAIILGNRTFPWRIRISITEEACTLNARPSRIDPRPVPHRANPSNRRRKYAARKIRPRISSPEWMWAQPGTIRRERIAGSGQRDA